MNDSCTEHSQAARDCFEISLLLTWIRFACDNLFIQYPIFLWIFTHWFSIKLSHLRFMRLLTLIFELQIKKIFFVEKFFTFFLDSAHFSRSNISLTAKFASYQTILPEIRKRPPAGMSRNQIWRLNDFLLYFYLISQFAHINNSDHMATNRTLDSFVGLCGCVSIRNILPVDDVKDCIDVARAKVFVLQVVSVLPNVDAEQRNESCCGLQRILIGALNDLEMTVLLVQSEPGPAASLDSDSGGLQLRLQVVHRIEVFDDSILQSIGWHWLLRRQIIPENAVIDVATAVETQCPLQGDNLVGVLLADRFIELLLSGVVVSHIRVVMFRMVDLWSSNCSQSTIASGGITFDHIPPWSRGKWSARGLHSRMANQAMSPWFSRM